MLLEVIIVNRQTPRYFRLTHANENGFFAPEQIFTEVDLEFESGLKWGLSETDISGVRMWNEAGRLIKMTDSLWVTVVDPASDVHLKRSYDEMCELGISRLDLARPCCRHSQTESFYT